MKNKVLTAIVSIVLASACLFAVACSGKQTSLQNRTDLPTQSATEAPTQAAEKETQTATPEPTPEPTEEPQATLNPEPGAEPFDLPEYDYEYDEDKFEETMIFFPENKKGKTDLNADHYDINPFAVRMALPKGWTYQNYIDVEEPFPPMGVYNPNDDGVTRLWSTLWFFDAEGKCVGAIGYEIFDESINFAEYTTPYIPSIYCSIAYGACRYHVTGQYDVVPNPWDNETAITYAYYGHQYIPEEVRDDMTSESGWKNPAIVSYDYDDEYYIAMEFDHRYVDDDLVMEIAKSLQLISKGAE